MNRRRSRGDRGESLVELLLAVAILGIAAVAILGGMLLGAKTSVLQRNQAEGGTYVRSFAEAVRAEVARSGRLRSCADTRTAYAALPVAGMPAAYTPSVAEVSVWDGSAWVACTNAADAAAQPVQRLRLRVDVPSEGEKAAAEELSIVLRQPCATTGVTSPCG